MPDLLDARTVVSHAIKCVQYRKMRTEPDGRAIANVPFGRDWNIKEIMTIHPGISGDLNVGLHSLKVLHSVEVMRFLITIILLIAGLYFILSRQI